METTPRSSDAGPFLVQPGSHIDGQGQVASTVDDSAISIPNLDIHMSPADATSLLPSLLTSSPNFPSTSPPTSLSSEAHAVPGYNAAAYDSRSPSLSPPPSPMPSYHDYVGAVKGATTRNRKQPTRYGFESQLVSTSVSEVSKRRRADSDQSAEAAKRSKTNGSVSKDQAEDVPMPDQPVQDDEQGLANQSNVIKAKAGKRGRGRPKKSTLAALAHDFSPEQDVIEQSPQQIEQNSVEQPQGPIRESIEASPVAVNRTEVKQTLLAGPVLHGHQRPSLVVRLKLRQHSTGKMQMGLPPIQLKIARVSPDMVEVSKQLAARPNLQTKPPARGQPAVFAEERQSLCETVMYYRSHQGSCYMNGGLVHSMLVAGNNHAHDYMGVDVIISRASGGMGLNTDGKLVQQKAQVENAQTRSMRKNMADQIPIVIICDKGNDAFPSRMDHKSDFTKASIRLERFLLTCEIRYSVLGFFKVTDVFARKGRVPKETVIQFRFEKLDPSKEGWWEPVGVAPPVRVGDLPAPAKHTCSHCRQTHEQVYLVWVCLTPKCSQYWKLRTGEEPRQEDLELYNPAWLKKKTSWENEEDPHDLQPLVVSTPDALNEAYPHSSTKGICCPKCGMCTSRYLFKGYYCDNPQCDFVHEPKPNPIPSYGLRDPYKLVGQGSPLSYDSATEHINYRHETTHNHRVNHFTIPGLDDNQIVHMIANQRVLEEPGGPDDMLSAMLESDMGMERSFLQSSKGNVLTTSTTLSDTC